MRTLELLKNVKRIANTKDIKGGISAEAGVSVTSIDLNNDYVLSSNQDGKDVQVDVFASASK